MRWRTARESYGGWSLAGNGELTNRKIDRRNRAAQCGASCLFEMTCGEMRNLTKGGEGIGVNAGRWRWGLGDYEGVTILLLLLNLQNHKYLKHKLRNVNDHS